MSEAGSVILNEYLPPQQPLPVEKMKPRPELSRFQQPIVLDGSQKNLSLLKPEGLLDRHFEPILPEQKRAAEENDELWIIDTARELQAYLTDLGDKELLNSEGKPIRLEDQLKKNHLELMLQLVLEKKQNGNFCIPIGTGENRAVLLTTPLRSTGADFPDPTIWGKEPAKQVAHHYYLVTAEGIFCLNFDKTMINFEYDRLPQADLARGQELTNQVLFSSLQTDQQKAKNEKKLLAWQRENETISGTKSLDELYGEHSERSFARAIQEFLYGNEYSLRLQSDRSLAEKDLEKDKLQTLINYFYQKNGRKPDEKELLELKKDIQPTEQEITQRATSLMKDRMRHQGIEKKGTLRTLQVGQFRISIDKVSANNQRKLLNEAIAASQANAQRPTVQSEPSAQEKEL